MPELKLSADCGNSPKNQFVERVTVALLLHDRDTLERLLSADLRWERIGDEAILDKAAILEGKHLPDADAIAALEIEHVLTHGKVGAVNGIARFESGRSWLFAAIYEFFNAKASSIKDIKLYLIEAD